MSCLLNMGLENSYNKQVFEETALRCLRLVNDPKFP